MHILLIEDEERTLHLIKEGLETQSYHVDYVYDGQKALELITNNTYDIIISDVIIPEINGINLVKKAREMGITTPIILLTALSSTDNKIGGLDAGADDYLTKPFEFKELFARIRALTRRIAIPDSDLNYDNQNLVIDDLELNPQTKIVKRAGQEITLTPKEFKLLELFMRNPNRVISKVELAEKIWEVTFDTGTNVIEVYVNFLRKKIDKGFDKKLIHTHIGMGYIFKK